MTAEWSELGGLGSAGPISLSRRGGGLAQCLLAVPSCLGKLEVVGLGVGFPKLDLFASTAQPAPAVRARADNRVNSSTKQRQTTE